MLLQWQYIILGSIIDKVLRLWVIFNKHTPLFEQVPVTKNVLYEKVGAIEYLKTIVEQKTSVYDLIFRNS